MRLHLPSWPGLGRITGQPSRHNPAGQPRLAVIGNCQAAAVARAMRLLQPRAEVRFLSAGTLGRRKTRPADFVRDLGEADFVFAQRITTGSLGLDHYAALADTHPGFHPVPAMVFAAFHPDLVYVGGPGLSPSGAFVNSPVGHYNSALVLYAYLAGLSVEHTARLFEAEIFAYLGYLDLWPYAQDTLLALGREADLDLGPALLRWTRRGCFMHSVNHPKMFVAADLARLLLARAGLAFDDFDLDSFLVDDLLLKGMWPVYEAIGRHYGVPGSYVFQAQARERQTRAPLPVFGLADFIAGSFAAYRAKPRAELFSDRVESWLANDDLRGSLRDRAG